ncbi:MAG: hypothetical protein PHF74_07980 [Dehalococcoidales bacterium]|nr:hypothetical protein [Dehalococcoidales bacterium]
MKGLRKSDEMEMSINLKAVRLAWAYSSVFLLVWVGYDWIKTSYFNGLAFILLMSQLAMYWAVQLFLKWKLGKDEK